MKILLLTGLAGWAERRQWRICLDESGIIV